MLREDVYYLICDPQGCQWRLTDSNDTLLAPPPEPWLYFRCEHCWRTVAVHRGSEEESLTKTGNHIRTSITGLQAYDVIKTDNPTTSVSHDNDTPPMPTALRKTLRSVCRGPYYRYEGVGGDGLFAMPAPEVLPELRCERGRVRDSRCTVVLGKLFPESLKVPARIRLDGRAEDPETAGSVGKFGRTRYRGVHRRRSEPAVELVEFVSFLIPRLRPIPNAGRTRFAPRAAPSPPCLRLFSRRRRLLFKVPVVLGRREHDARSDPCGVLTPGEPDDSRRPRRGHPASILGAVDQDQVVPVALDDRARLQLLARGSKLAAQGFGEFDPRFFSTQLAATVTRHSSSPLRNCP